MLAELPSQPVSSSAVVIAVDGPVAAGKGTLARRRDTVYGYAYLDTGALYRAVGAKVLREGGDPGNPVAAAAAADGLADADLKAPELRPEPVGLAARSEEHTSELQSPMRISYAALRSKTQNNTASQTYLLSKPQPTSLILT